MLIVYIIGRYIHNYVKKVSRKKILFFCIVTFCIELVLNGIATAKAGFVGVSAPYAYDYSIFILVIGICVFLIFNSFNFHNKLINYISRSNLSVHLLDNSVRLIVPLYIDLSYGHVESLLPLYAIIYALFIFIMGFIFDVIRRFIFGYIENKLTNIIVNYVNKFFSLLNKS